MCFGTCDPTDRPSRARGDETGRPDRPTLSQPVTPADPTRATRPTDSPAPDAPPRGWVGAPDRPTHSEAVPDTQSALSTSRRLGVPTAGSSELVWLTHAWKAPPSYQMNLSKKTYESHTHYRGRGAQATCPRDGATGGTSATPLLPPTPGLSAISARRCRSHADLYPE